MQEIYQRRDGREEQEITINTRNRREIVYSLLATSCGLYFTRAASLARACSSLAGDPWRRLFFVLVPQSTFYLSVLLRNLRNLGSNSTTCTTPHVCQRRFHKISGHKSHTVCTWYGGEALTIAFIFIPQLIPFHLSQTRCK